MSGLSGAGQWRCGENNVDIVECVMRHQMREADKDVREHVRKEEQVIVGFFIRPAICRRFLS